MESDEGGTLLVVAGGAVVQQVPAFPLWYPGQPATISTSTGDSNSNDGISINANTNTPLLNSIEKEEEEEREEEAEVDIAASNPYIDLYLDNANAGGNGGELSSSSSSRRKTTSVRLEGNSSNKSKVGLSSSNRSDKNNPLRDIRSSSAPTIETLIKASERQKISITNEVTITGQKVVTKSLKSQSRPASASATSTATTSSKNSSPPKSAPHKSAASYSNSNSNSNSSNSPKKLTKTERSKSPTAGPSSSKSQKKSVGGIKKKSIGGNNAKSNKISLSDTSAAIIKEWVETAKENLLDNEGSRLGEQGDNIFDLLPIYNLSNNKGSNGDEIIAVEPLDPLSEGIRKPRPTKRMFGSITRAERAKPFLFVWDKEKQDCDQLLVSKRVTIMDKLHITPFKPKKIGSLKTEYSENFKGLQPKSIADKSEPDNLENNVDYLTATAAKTLDAANLALNSLNKADVIEVKAFFKPPKGVDDIFAATMILLAGIHPDIILNKNGSVKDTSWEACKKQLLKSIPEYMDSLKGIQSKIDSETMPKKNMELVRPLLELEHFVPEIIRSKSKAAESICGFVRNIVTYYELNWKIKALKAASLEDDQSSPKTKSKIGKSRKDKNSKSDIIISGGKNDCTCWVSESNFSYKRYDSANYKIAVDVYDELEERRKKNKPKQQGAPEGVLGKVLVMKKLTRKDTSSKEKQK